MSLQLLNLVRKFRMNPFTLPDACTNIMYKNANIPALQL